MTSSQTPKVVILGGGTGLPVLLRGLKKFPIDITAIVTVADDGGSSGKLRSEMDIPPPGDIRNVLAALSEVEPLVEGLFQHRFEKGNELSGHALGNLLLAAMTTLTGDFVSAIGEMSKVLNVKGRVLPAANRSVVLHAEMEDGSMVTGESQIPKVDKKIKRVFLSPEEIEALPESLEAIRQADIIVIGPGSLYTSILPNLLVKSIGKEVCEASAEKVYVCNLMTQPGETVGYTASDHLQTLHDHLGQKFIDAIIVNNADVSLEVLKRYKKENAVPVTCDESKMKQRNIKVIADSLIKYDDGVIRHDTDKISQIIFSLLNK